MDVITNPSNSKFDDFFQYVKKKEWSSTRPQFPIGGEKRCVSLTENNRGSIKQKSYGYFSATTQRKRKLTDFMSTVSFAEHYTAPLHSAENNNTSLIAPMVREKSYGHVLSDGQRNSNLRVFRESTGYIQVDSFASNHEQGSVDDARISRLASFIASANDRFGGTGHQIPRTNLNLGPHYSFKLVSDKDLKSVEGKCCGITLEELSDLDDPVVLKKQLYSLKALQGWINVKKELETPNGREEFQISEVFRVPPIKSCK
ncbi:hypothetical protein [Endozoicomonas sp.]|uniref:hypothetical protein n=1 Tax=Endozoicomonas sp. TaxID=1892382 RepID=UPI003AF903A8